MSGRWLVDEPTRAGSRWVRVVLVRHAESEWNVEGRIQGQLGSGLSEQGRAQALDVAGYLRHAYPRVALIVSSDLERVTQTVEPYADVATVRLEKRLREIDNGEWTGRTTADVAAAYPEQIAAIRRGEDIPRGGGETFAQMRARVWDALCDLAGEPQAAIGTVVAFTHGGPIRVAVAEALRLPPGGHRLLEPPANCSVTELVLLVDGDGTVTSAALAGYNGVHLARTSTSAATEDDVARVVTAT